MEESVFKCTAIKIFKGIISLIIKTCSEVLIHLQVND